MTALGYPTSREHLHDELRRVDWLIRAQVVRWRATLADTKPSELWGMAHVTEREVDAFLSSPFTSPDELAPALHTLLAGFWEQAAVAADEIARRLEVSDPGVSRLSRLMSRFSLSALERDILLVALLAGLDQRYRRLMGYLQDDCSRHTPTVELIAQILRGCAEGAAVRSALEPTARLRVTRLVQVEPAETRPWPLRGVSVDDRVAGFLCEQDGVDATIAGCVDLTEAADDGLLRGEHRQTPVGRVLDWVRAPSRGEGAPIVLLHGPPGGRTGLARMLCRAAGASALVVDADAASRSPLGWSEIVDLVYREAALRGAWVIWRPKDAMSTADRACLLQAARTAAEATVVISRGPLAVDARFGHRPVVVLETPQAGPLERERLWRAGLRDGAALEATAGVERLAAQLAGTYRLSAGQIQGALVAAAASARGRDPHTPRITADDLARGCRAQAGVTSSELATRRQPRADLGLSQLVIPAATRAQIDELRRRIAGQSRLSAALGLAAHRSARGLTAMFTGSSGCGKTLAAEALAGELGVDLYQVDLSALVSKYVGETEKNLARVFEQIENSNGILFFDEADALFGKRGDVVDARDRWANTEVNYLLQSLERYEGVVILATNLRQNIDSAFMRRIQLVIEFPFPDADCRLRLWRGLLGPAGDLSEAELAPLADRFQLAGGSIANIVVDAISRAVAQPGSGAPQVTPAHLAHAIAAEYRKLGKPVTPGEFGSELYELATRPAPTPVPS
jgi:ATPase family associated with various cellular activities (AAA)